MATRKEKNLKGEKAKICSLVGKNAKRALILSNKNSVDIKRVKRKEHDYDICNSF